MQGGRPKTSGSTLGSKPRGIRSSECRSRRQRRLPVICFTQCNLFHPMSMSLRPDLPTHIPLFTVEQKSELGMQLKAKTAVVLQSKTRPWAKQGHGPAQDQLTSEASNFKVLPIIDFKHISCPSFLTFGVSPSSIPGRPVVV